MSDVTDVWFPDAQATTRAEVRFLVHLRHRATGWTELGLDAGFSTSVPVAKPFVGIELPHLSAPLRWLWILFLDSRDGLAVDCEWGDNTRFNDWGPIDGNVYASTPDPRVTPEEMAERAANWVQTQSGRVIRRDDWTAHRSRTRWTFMDTGAVLTETRPAPRWKDAKPDASTIERIRT